MMRLKLWSLVMAVAMATAACEEVGSQPAIDERALQQDLQSAVNVANGFWGTYFPQFFRLNYRPPKVLGSYDESRLPSCGGQPTVARNAFYCIPDDYVAWDIGLMRDGYAIGDSWVYMVIAHEWGHVVQARVGERRTSVALELQADCLAAVVLFGAARDGAITFEPGDVKELVAALNVVGDETPWTNPEDHGDSLERIEAFKRGRDGGIRACLPD